MRFISEISLPPQIDSDYLRNFCRSNVLKLLEVHHENHRLHQTSLGHHRHNRLHLRCFQICTNDAETLKMKSEGIDFKRISTLPPPKEAGIEGGRIFELKDFQ